MSQNQSEAAFFYLGQDRLAIDKLSVFGTELGIVTKTQRGATKITQEIVKKTRLKSSLSTLRHFTEHLVDVFGNYRGRTI
jgi:hypothetical protein